MKLTLLVFALTLIGCGGGSSNSAPSTSMIPAVQPVHAATGFTNASLSGTYAFGISGTVAGVLDAGTGVVALDGNGNISAGDETENIGGTLCHGTFSGTYSVNSNGTGTATITTTEDAASQARGCGPGGTGSANLALANGGSQLVLANQNSNVTLITAVKQ